MNGPARVQDLSQFNNKELRDKKTVPDTKNSKKKIDKVIEPVGAMDCSFVPEGTIEKDI